MKKFYISRVFCIRLEWIVRAESPGEALRMLDDEELTPNETAKTEWLGPYDACDGALVKEMVREA